MSDINPNLPAGDTGLASSPQHYQAHIYTRTTIFLTNLAVNFILNEFNSFASHTDKQEKQNQQSPNPIVQVRTFVLLNLSKTCKHKYENVILFTWLFMSLQETASSVSVSATSVVYSVLEFPKRASALSDIIPNDAEYANISYAEKM